MIQAAGRLLARLSFVDGHIVVTPKDREMFLVSAEKAIEAYSNGVERDRHVERFQSTFLVPLHDWCMCHAQAVRACYLPLPGPSIKVFIVASSSEFDFALANDVAQLELQLARAGWRVSVLQLPHADESSLATFFNFQGALEVYAESGSASQKGSA